MNLWKRKTRYSTPSLYPDATLQPGSSLHLKAFGVVFSLTVMATALCGIVAGWLATSTLDEASKQSVIRLSQTINQLVVSDIANERNDLIKENINQLLFDKSISFAVITNSQNKIIHHAFNQPSHWHLYNSEISPIERQQAIGMNKPIRIKTQNDWIVYTLKTPIWTNSNQQKKVLGYLTIAQSNNTHITMLNHLYFILLGVVGVISIISIPVIIFWTKSWINPIRDMLKGTLQLGMGQVFEPVNINRNDEIGLLGNSFNAMGANLCAIQDALVRANEKLEEKVKNRTAELEHANKRLHQEARDKDEFIRTVSHDLNAPLRNILGMSQRLLHKYEAELSDDAIKKLERISANARAESELLSDLLEISRLKTMPGKEQEIDINQLLEQVAESLANDLESNNIKFEIQKCLPIVVADKIRLRQVFQNLIDNAIKYMDSEKSEKTISIYTSMLEDKVVFHVSDNGRGISDKDKDRIFQLFQRARYSGQHENTDSRGVGLSSVQTIIEAYGGRIWVESELGKGSTFKFTLSNHIVHTNLQCLADLIHV